jgi:hypothetical protein
MYAPRAGAAPTPAPLFNPTAAGVIAPAQPGVAAAAAPMMPAPQAATPAPVPTPVVATAPELLCTLCSKLFNVSSTMHNIFRCAMLLDSACTLARQQPKEQQGRHSTDTNPETDHHAARRTL